MTHLCPHLVVFADISMMDGCTLVATMLRNYTVVGLKKKQKKNYLLITSKSSDSQRGKSIKARCAKDQPVAFSPWSGENVKLNYQEIMLHVGTSKAPQLFNGCKGLYEDGRTLSFTPPKSSTINVMS